MYFILGLFIITSIISITLFIKQDNENWIPVIIASCVIMIIATIALKSSYDSDSSFIQIVQTHQETINEIIGDREDPASGRERAELVKTIIETNARIKQLQIDNANWLWSLETPDAVDDLKPLKMSCVCSDQP